MKSEINLSDGLIMYNGDCLEAMDYILALAYKPFKLVFSDPPYNVGKDYHGYSDSRELDDYFNWTERWIDRALTASRGRLFIYPPKIHLRRFWNMVPMNHLIVCGYSPSGAIRGRYIHQYVPLLAPPDPYDRIPDHWWNSQIPALGYFYREEKFDHPGQTSLDITQRAIHAFTSPGDWVLDPFGGVGTTAIACINLGRNCVIIEQSERYCDIAIRRIEKALQQPNLFTDKEPK